MPCVYYIADFVAQIRKFLAEFVNNCGMVEIIDDHSVCRFFLTLIGIVKYIILFEVLYEFSLCFRRFAI
jgi:hypothetical protein